MGTSVPSLSESRAASLKRHASAGGDNKVQVELAKYEPNIKCDTSSKPGPLWLSCVSVFSNMRASKQYRVFGSYDQPNIEEGLPLVLEAGE